MQAIQTFLKKWWPLIAPGVVAIWGVYGTQVQAFVSAHPSISGVVSVLYIVFVHLMPSPVASFASGPTKGSVMTVKADSAGK